MNSLAKLKAIATTSPDNDDRAAYAQEALDAFVAICPTDDCDAIRDLICDLGHLADRRGLNFQEEVRVALAGWESEKEEEL